MPLSPDDFKLAVMALLAERFQLQVHQETRDIPGFRDSHAENIGRGETCRDRRTIFPQHEWRRRCIYCSADEGADQGDWVREALEDVGFRVEGQKIPMEVTVVDRCERPGGN